MVQLTNLFGHTRKLRCILCMVFYKLEGTGAYGPLLLLINEKIQENLLTFD